LERQGLVQSALKAAELARDLLLAADPAAADQLDRVHTNLGRLLAKLGRYAESIAAYRRVTSSTFHSQVGLALSHFYAGQLRWVLIH
jgi:tetratricopeptide (TPR) repeat protein